MMTVAVVELTLMISKVAITACTFNLVHLAFEPLLYVVDKKIAEIEARNEDIS